MNNSKLIADVFEAIEFAKKYSNLYSIILKQTGDKQQAIDAVLYINKIENQTIAESTKFN